GWGVGWGLFWADVLCRWPLTSSPLQYRCVKYDNFCAHIVDQALRMRRQQMVIPVLPRARDVTYLITKQTFQFDSKKSFCNVTRRYSMENDEASCW
ncbi:Alanine racemase, partial [Frankliniella fusca]